MEGEPAGTVFYIATFSYKFSLYHLYPASHLHPPLAYYLADKRPTQYRFSLAIVDGPLRLGPRLISTASFQIFLNTMHFINDPVEVSNE